MERELALEIGRVTEVAAIASAEWMGLGKKMEADQAATTAMRHMFDTMALDGTVVIGEGEMDEAPMLYIGEKLGDGNGPHLDIAVDPLEGTNILVNGSFNALSVVAVAPAGTLLHAPDIYMQKLAVGSRARGKVDIDQPIKENVLAVAKALGKNTIDVVVAVLDRERHANLIQEIRSTGARIKLLSDGDVAAAINTGFDDTGVDMMVGIGGAPEGVLSAAALKCVEGDFQARLLPENEEQMKRCLQMGIMDPSKVLYMEDLVAGDDVIFSATGVTDGELLRGVRFLSENKVTTHSLIMRGKTGTIRFITARHDRSKKRP